MSKILKLDSEPMIKSYLHHAVINSIISGNVGKDNNGVVMRINVNDEFPEAWSVNPRFDYSINGGLSMQDYGPEQYDFMYRLCLAKDSITVRIDELCNKEKNAILNFVITVDDFENNIKNNQNTYKIGIMDGHILTRHEKRFVIHKAVKSHECKYLRLTRDDNIIESSISKDGEEWKLIEKHEVDFLDSSAKIGIIAENLTHSNYLEEYWNWICMNYIQLGYNPHEIGGVYFDYKMFPVKKCRYEYVYACHFLDISYTEPSEIIDLLGNIRCYIDWCLRNNVYISLAVDEYYVYGRKRYHKEHFLHHNLFYGYDEKNEEYLVMGYDTHLSINSIKSAELEMAFDKLQGVIMTYRFEKNIYPLDLSVDKVISELENFLNPDRKLQTNILQEDMIYGINTILAFCNSSEGRYQLQHDNRISYILYEHSCLMQKRMEIIGARYLFSFNSELVDLGKEMVLKAKYIKNLVIKNKLKNYIYEEKILNAVEEFYELEKQFCTSFIVQLKEINNND